jgi:hypothetical protein
MIFLLLSGTLTGMVTGEFASKVDNTIQSGSRASSWGIVDTITTTVQIDAGEKYYIYFDNTTGELKNMEMPSLADECQQALALVPEWIRSNLTFKLRQLSNDDQKTYANLIINAHDSKYIDEIGFVVAHSSLDALQHTYYFPQLITDNAKYIYQNEQYLPYVDIVEKTDYTTLSYKNKTNTSHELPRDIYYWYVVHPQLSDELPTYVDPNYDFTSQAPGSRNYGVSPPTGKFWREWLFYYNDSANYSGNKKSNPLLKNLLSNRDTIWEAISGINNWISNSFKFTSNNERPNQPVRIYRKHIGRCGEHQDMRAAAGRAALIPSTCTSNPAEDHAWNEFWDERWIHWDGDCDNPMKYENGWGKDISSVWSLRGDGYIWSVTHKYTETCNYTVTVLDSAGNPVDGAEVWIGTENYYDPQYLTITTWGTTDYTGQVTIELGDRRNYWASADTENLGEDPPDAGGNERLSPVITNSGTGNYYTTFDLPQAAAELKANKLLAPDIKTRKYRMDTSIHVDGNILAEINYMTREHSDLYSSGGNIDFFIADSDNFSKYQDGDDFDVLELFIRKDTESGSCILPTDDTWYAVLSNEFSQATTKIVNITIDIYGTLFTEIITPHDNEELDLDSTIRIQGTTFSPFAISVVEIEFSDKSGNWPDVTDNSGSTDEPWSSWSYDWNTSGWQPGKHRIRIRAIDTMESILISINISLIDVSAPVITITELLINSSFRMGEIISIYGTVTDNVDVTYLGLEIDADNTNTVELTDSILHDKWSYDLDTNSLAEGDYTITIDANDAMNNYNNNSIRIILLEIIAPVVEISEPMNNSVFKLGDNVSFFGKAIDNKGIRKIELTIDGVAPINITGSLTKAGYWDYLWYTDGSSINEGTYNITVRAFDAAGNNGSVEIIVNLDNTPPMIYVTELMCKRIVNQGSGETFDGTVFDNFGISHIEVMVDNGKPTIVIEDINSSEWSYDGPDTSRLKSGQHTVTFRATDLAGFTDEASTGFWVDAAPPEAQINEISDPVLIGETVLLSGTATDDLNIITLELYLPEDEEVKSYPEYNPLTGEWNYTWNTSNMIEGDHEIGVTVDDQLYKSDSAKITVKIISVSTDTDNDGMPDWWERQYEKFDIYEDDASFDYDRDGISNLDEYLGDDKLPGNDDYSDPNDRTSVPMVKDDRPDDKGGIGTIAIAAIAVAVIIIILIILLLMFRKRKQEVGDEESEQTLTIEPTIVSEPQPHVPTTIGKVPQPMIYAPMIPPQPKTIAEPVKHLKPPAATTPSLPPASDDEEKLPDEKPDPDDPMKFLAETLIDSALTKINSIPPERMKNASVIELFSKAQTAIEQNDYNTAMEYAGKCKEEADKLQE